MGPEIGHAREAYDISFGTVKLSGSACECQAGRVSDFTRHSHIAEADYAAENTTCSMDIKLTSVGTRNGKGSVTG